MNSHDIIFPVLMAKTGVMIRAAAELQSRGIACRHSRPKKREGILRVTPADAARAREILREILDDPSAIVSESSAAWFFCPDCESPLSLGAFRCPKCNALVGDPHGR